MSFPRQFGFAGKEDDARERIGNSVPPLFMRSIAGHVRREILDKLDSHSPTGAAPAPPALPKTS